MSSVEPRGSCASGPRVSNTAAKSRESTSAGADARTFRAAGNRTDARASSRGCRYGCSVFSLPAPARHFAFGIRGFISAAVRSARRADQTHGVAIWKYQGVEPHAKFAATLDASGTLGIEQFTAHIRANRDDHAIILSNRKRSPQVNGISRFGIARGNSIFQNYGDARSGRHGYAFRTSADAAQRSRWPGALSDQARKSAGRPAAAPEPRESLRLRHLERLQRISQNICATQTFAA